MDIATHLALHMKYHAVNAVAEVRRKICWPTGYQGCGGISAGNVNETIVNFVDVIGCCRRGGLERGTPGVSRGIE